MEWTCSRADVAWWVVQEGLKQYHIKVNCAYRQLLRCVCVSISSWIYGETLLEDRHLTIMQNVDLYVHHLSVWTSSFLLLSFCKTTATSTTTTEMLNNSYFWQDHFWGDLCFMPEQEEDTVYHVYISSSQKIFISSSLFFSILFFSMVDICHNNI